MRLFYVEYECGCFLKHKMAGDLKNESKTSSYFLKAVNELRCLIHTKRPRKTISLAEYRRKLREEKENAK